MPDEEAGTTSVMKQKLAVRLSDFLGVYGKAGVLVDAAVVL